MGQALWPLPEKVPSEHGGRRISHLPESAVTESKLKYQGARSLEGLFFRESQTSEGSLEEGVCVSEGGAAPLPLLFSLLLLFTATCTAP